jgi:outer membrane protein
MERIFQLSSQLIKRSAIAAVLSVSLFGFALGSVPVAEAETELKVAFVDLQKALAMSKAGKAAQTSYQREVKKAQSGIDKKKGEFEKRKESFQKQRDNLNERALVEKEEELLQLKKDIERDFKDSQQKLQRKNAVMVGDLIKKIREAVASVGKEKSLTVIFEKSSQTVLYADTSIDITDEVVARFDKMTN